MPEIKKELDERKSVYSKSYIEIISGSYDVSESKLDILVSKIPPDYGCNFESCAHRTVTVNLPTELKLYQIGYIGFKISVLQDLGPFDDGRSYEFFVDLISKKSLQEAKILLSEGATVLEENKETLLQDETTINYIHLRQYEDISRVSIVFCSLDPESHCSIWDKKPIDLVITSNSNYERFWRQQSPPTTEQEEQPTAEILQECEAFGIKEENCSIGAIHASKRQRATDMEVVGEQNSMISDSFTVIGIGAAIAGLIAFVTLRKMYS
jgi:hypothetical protein